MPVARNPEAKLGKPITFRMTPELERQIDAFMRAKGFRYGEAIRALIEMGLQSLETPVLTDVVSMSAPSQKDVDALGTALMRWVATGNLLLKGNRDLTQEQFQALVEEGESNRQEFDKRSEGSRALTPEDPMRRVR